MSMHGYEPPKQNEPGSWGELWAVMLAVFLALAWPLLVMVVVVTLAIGTVIAFFTNVWLALIPAAVLALIAVYFVRRDKRLREELEREVRGQG